MSVNMQLRIANDNVEWLAAVHLVSSIQFFKKWESIFKLVHFASLFNENNEFITFFALSFSRKVNTFIVRGEKGNLEIIGFIYEINIQMDGFVFEIARNSSRYDWTKIKHRINCVYFDYKR